MPLVETSDATRMGDPSGATVQGEVIILISGTAGLPVRQISGPVQRGGRIEPLAEDAQAIREVWDPAALLKVT